MKKTNTIKIDKEKKDKMINAIKIYFENERDEQLGDLAANMILDFFMEKLAPDIYNQGVYDSYKYFLDRIDDLLSIQKY